ncbi:MAG: ArsA-related P-loop ATPase [Myxococcaceae bacterium]
MVLVTGKGGVGKTTVAAAVAKVFAKQGKRVLCGEVAPDSAAPSAMAEALGGGGIVTEEPLEVAPNIWAVLLTPAMGHRRFLQDTLPIKLLADAAMRSAAVRKFLMAAPGFADMGVMYRLLDLVRRKQPDGRFEFDACVIDSPATGHALALAQIPELLARVIPAGPIGRTAREGLELMTDPVQCGAVVVTLPETLPVTEAQELCAGLTKRRVPLLALVVNRVPADPFTSEERSAVDRLLAAQEPVLGARELRRIDRAALAIRSLGPELPAPLTLVPEFPDRNGALTERIAAILSAN